MAWLSGGVNSSSVCMVGQIIHLRKNVRENFKSSFCMSPKSISSPSFTISVAGASQPVFCCGLTRRPGDLWGVLFFHRFDSICWKVCGCTISFKKSLATKFSEKSIWERELGKRKTVRYGYTVVANMVFVQGRTSGKILTNNPELARWTLDGLFGKHKEQPPFLRKQRIISLTWAGQGRKLMRQPPLMWLPKYRV